MPYTQAVGSLMYIMLCTRPYLTYSVSLVSRYQSKPEPAHWEVVKRIMKYIKDILQHKLVYQVEILKVLDYSNVDYGGNKDDGKSTSGHLFIFSGGTVSWGSKK